MGDRSEAGGCARPGRTDRPAGPRDGGAGKEVPDVVRVEHEQVAEEHDAVGADLVVAELQASDESPSSPVISPSISAFAAYAVR